MYVTVAPSRRSTVGKRVYCLVLLGRSVLYSPHFVKVHVSSLLLTGGGMSLSPLGVVEQAEGLQRRVQLYTTDTDAIYQSNINDNSF